MGHSDRYDELYLFQQIAGGDEKAFRNLIDVYNPILFPTINKIVKDTGVCEDIMQETYLRIWLYRDTLPSIEKPRAWILKIAYLQAFTFLRINKKQFKIKEEVYENTSAANVDMEKTLDYNLLSRLIKAAVSALPDQQKKVYKLSREEGLSLDEIAETMSLAPQSVKNTMSRALQFIRNYIVKSGYLL